MLSKEDFGWLVRTIDACFTPVKNGAYWKQQIEPGGMLVACDKLNDRQEWEMEEGLRYLVSTNQYPSLVNDTHYLFHTLTPALSSGSLYAWYDRRTATKMTAGSSGRSPGKLILLWLISYKQNRDLHVMGQVEEADTYFGSQRR